MTTKNEVLGPSAVLKLPKPVGELSTYGKAMSSRLASDASFSGLPIVLSTFDEHIGELDKAQTAVMKGAKGAVAQRNAKRNQVILDMQQIRDHVQSVARKNTDPVTAAAIIESALLTVKKMGQRSKPELRAKNGDVPGDVVLMAKAVAAVAMYYWEHSTNQTDWTIVPPTMQAKTVISGLSSRTMHYFRFRAQTRSSQGDYSQVVSLLVR